jgi:replicative DNA helicase
VSRTAVISRFRSVRSVDPQPEPAAALASKLELGTSSVPKGLVASPGWSAAEFNGTRSLENVVRVHFLVFDFDQGAPPWEKFERFDYFAHTTHSHTADKPRWRLILTLSAPIEAADWGKYLFEAWALSDDSWKGAADSGRFWFLPPTGCETRRHVGEPWQAPPKPKPLPKAPVAKQGPIRVEGHPYSLRALRGECDRIRAATPGGRHTVIHAAAAAIGEHVAGGGLQPSALSEIVAAARAAYGPEWAGRQRDEKRNIRQAYEKGLLSPRYPPEPSPWQEPGKDFGPTEYAELEVAPPIPIARPRAAVPSRGIVGLDPSETAPEWETDWLPAPLRDWVEACVVAFAVPRSMAIMCGLSVVAAIVQGKVSVRIKPGWEEPLCLYTIIASKTGSLKSATLTAAMAPARWLEAKRASDGADETYEAICRKARLEAELGKLRRSIPKRGTPTSNNTNAYGEHIELIRNVERELKTCRIPSSPIWFVDDINPTVILRRMRANLEAEGIARMAAFSAEGTFLHNAMGKLTSHGVNVDLLNKAYVGEPYDAERTSRTSDSTVLTRLPACYLTMLMVVQPHILDAARAKSELADNGFIGRCITIVLPETVRRPAADDPGIPEHIQAAYESWVIAHDSIPAGTVIDLSACMLDEDGPLRALYDDSTRLLAEEVGAAGWITRSVGRIARLTGLVALTQLLTVRLSDCQGHPVDVGVWGLAREVGDLIINSLIYPIHTAGLRTSVRSEPASGSLTSLTLRTLAYLKRSDSLTVTKRQLQRALTLSEVSADAVLTDLCGRGHLELIEERTNRNKTLTSLYKVISTDPEGDYPGNKGAAPPTIAQVIPLLPARRQREPGED